MRLGVLGLTVLDRLKTFGFELRGWNRSPRDVEGVETFAGGDQLDRFLQACDMLVCLLPLTPATQDILNRELFASLPRGAAVINVGRSEHLIAADLLEALDCGQLSRAILDVTDPEPLPPEHPFWSHPRIFVTPHVRV